jgi:uncharacterized DUF497 family protein
MRLHDHFEWDPDKADANLKKHGVAFGDAARVLADDDGDAFHVEEPDPGHSVGEDRYVTTGSDPDDRRVILLISWTDRSTDTDQVTRIISARNAIPRERKLYAKEIRGR